MNKFSLWTLGAALIAVPAMAAPGGTGQADADGVLTRAKAEANAAAMFTRMDANKDGKLDAADRAAKRAEMHERKFASLDADSNGSISKDEWNKHGADRAARSSEAATAGEGKRGFRGKRGGHGMGMHMMAKADADGDKAISPAEFQTAALARFDAADANKDGQVTAEERKAQRGERRAKRAPASAVPASE